MLDVTTKMSSNTDCNCNKSTRPYNMMMQTRIDTCVELVHEETYRAHTAMAIERIEQVG